jgi:hypothetical protein
MTALEFVGCSLIIFGPPVMLFFVFIANDPLKVIVLTASAFFWLISLLLSSIVWFSVVPLKNYPAFALVFSVIFQELMRLLLFYTVRRAELGLQRLAILEEEVFIQPAGSAMVHGGSSTHLESPLPGSSDTTHANEELRHIESERISQSTPGQPISNRKDVISKEEGAISPRALSYVAGLGFGLAYGVFSSINMLADMIGPATIGFRGEPSHFFISSSFIILAMILLQTVWSVITFHAIHCGSRTQFLVIAAMHMTLSCLTLLNRMAEGALIAIIVILYAVLVGCAGWAFHMMGGNHRNLFALVQCRN